MDIYTGILTVCIKRLVITDIYPLSADLEMMTLSSNKHNISNKMNQGYLEKCLIIGLGPELYMES